MELSIHIENLEWNQIYVIPRGTTEEQLQVEVYKEIRKAAGEVNNHLACYSWGTKTEVKYCGSVARDYQHGGYRSSLEGRVHNYFKNHRQQENGRKNSNLNVFENICQTLQNEDVILSVLSFERVTLGDKVFTYQEYSENPELIQAVELLLVCYYKNIGQSPWNRTPSTRVKEPRLKPVRETLLTIGGETMIEQLVWMKGKIYKTLAQKKQFEILDVDPNAIYIKISNDNERRISRKEIEEPWMMLKQHGILTQTQIFDLGTVNSAYIASILANVPGVTYKLSPTTLFYIP